VRATREHGGLFTHEDLADWQVHIEEPVSTRYRDIDVYKLTTWVQGPAMLQALNILEGFDLQAMGYNSARYIHTLYQAMNLAFADRDFYYGDPVHAAGGARRAACCPRTTPRPARAEIDPSSATIPDARPGDPYPYQGGENPFRETAGRMDADTTPGAEAEGHDGFQQAGITDVARRGIPGGHDVDTGCGRRRLGRFPSPPAAAGYRRLSPAVPASASASACRASSSTSASTRSTWWRRASGPRATLTPSLALRDGVPIMAFSVQGGDTQDQNLLQFFLNIVEFGMNVQQAAEAHNITSYQMQSSFGAHQSEPGRLAVTRQIPPYTRDRLKAMGYDLEVVDRTYSPITAILIDPEQGTFQGGASDYGDDYGIAW
jgi:gamma-glutamyltranspeptidase/glutathione hydrolase